MYFTLVLTSLSFIVIVLYTFQRERLALYHPLLIFFLWHFLGFVFAPWHLELNQNLGFLRRAGIPLNTDYYLVKTLILVNVGFLAVVLGYFAWYGRDLAHRINLPRIEIGSRSALLVGIPFIILAIYAISQYHYVPGISQKVVNPYVYNEFGSTIYAESTGYVVLAPRFFFGIGLLWFLMAWRKRGLGWPFLATISIAAYLLFAIFKGHHRAGWVLFLFGLFCFWLLLKQLRWPPRWTLIPAIPLLAILFVIFNISAVDRSAWRKIIDEGYSVDWFADRARDRVVERGVRNDISTYEFDIYRVVLYPDKLPYEWGAGFFNSWVVAALPRAIFKNKNSYMLQDNLHLIGDGSLHHTAGACDGLYIGFYYNFGIIGMMICCFLFGVIMRACWELVCRYPARSPAYQYVPLIYAGLLCYYPQLLRDGLTGLVPNYFFILTPIFIVLFINRRIQYQADQAALHLKSRMARIKIMRISSE